MVIFLSSYDVIIIIIVLVTYCVVGTFFRARAASTPTFVVVLILTPPPPTNSIRLNRNKITIDVFEIFFTTRSIIICLLYSCVVSRRCSQTKPCIIFIFYRGWKIEYASSHTLRLTKLLLDCACEQCYYWINNYIFIIMNSYRMRRRSINTLGEKWTSFFEDRKNK